MRAPTWARTRFYRTLIRTSGTEPHQENLVFLNLQINHVSADFLLVTQADDVRTCLERLYCPLVERTLMKA